MNRLLRVCSMLGIFCVVPAALAGGNDNPLLYMVKAEQLEWRDAEQSTYAWDAHVWAGYDRDKLWLKTEGETNRDTTEDFELQLLWSRAIAPNWDLQTGWRGDFQPGQNRSWLAIGAHGLAPGFIETDVALFLASGRAAARAKFAYELLLTQRVVLEPRAELNAYSEDDPVNGIGSGLSELELGLRLRYEITPKFAPYIGLHWEKLLGDTASLARVEGEDSSDLQFVAGLRVWF